MKKIDKLLLTSFIGPFAVSFGIALFVLVMQFLWLYIDEIAGKGVSIFVMLELIRYLSISTFPMALPIAVLIASVMVMGNLAERYELSSMKSAGVGLLRIMRGLIICATGVGLFSYVCSDFLIPISNLRFKSRLYDIRKQKPALTLEKGIFNEDFRQFVIRIGDKAADGETISDVLIEDQSNVGKVQFSQILADSGQMFTTTDKRYFVMNLFEGTQYQEPSPGQSPGQKQKYPFIRINFKSWTKVWDMKEFDMNATDPERFKTQRSMLSMSQLRQSVDSLNRVVAEGKTSMATELTDKVRLTVSTNPRLIRPKPPVLRDTTQHNTPTSTTNNTKLKILAATAKTVPPHIGPAPQSVVTGPKLPQQELQKPLTQYLAFEEVFRTTDRPKLRQDALKNADAVLTTAKARAAQIENRQKDMVKTAYELYIKYSFALVCFVFLFIGGPMGAIIRKGGFGVPILVAIIFFVTFIMLTILCRKLAEAFVMSPFWAAMLPCLALAPIGVFLTRKAMNDSQMLNTDRLERLIHRLRRRVQSPPTMPTPTLPEAA